MDTHSDRSRNWCCSGTDIPKSEIVYFAQVVLVYCIVFASLLNLSIGTENNTLWIALLSSSVGYILPQPTLKRHGVFLPHSTQQHPV